MTTAVQTDGTEGPAPAGSGLDWSRRSRALTVFWFFALPCLLGVGLALLVHIRVVLPRIGAGSPDITRVFAVGSSLQTPLPAGSIVFVGDSVTVEGIDARIVADSAGRPARNLAVNGGNPTEVAVMLPMVLRAGPRHVVFTLRARSLGEPIELDADKGWAYCWGKFPEAWPQSWLTHESPGFSRESMAWLKSPPFKDAQGVCAHDAERL